MKKIIPVIFFLLVIHRAGHGQNLNVESGWRDRSLHSLDTARQDTSRVLFMVALANYYKSHFPDSVLFYSYKAVALARQIDFPKGEAAALFYITVTQNTLGNHSKALETTLRGLKIAEKNNLPNVKAQFLCALGHVYSGVKNYTKALNLHKESKALYDSIFDSTYSALQHNYIAETYLMMNRPDSALYFCRPAYEFAVRSKVKWLIYPMLINFGKIQLKKGNADVALVSFRRTLSMAGTPITVFNSYFAIAQVYQQINKPDSCIYYAKKSLEVVQGRGFYSNIVDASILLSGIYEKIDPQKTIQYGKMALYYKDSLYNLGRTTSFENLNAFDEQERQNEIETANTAYRSKVKQYILIGSLSVFLLVAFIVYRTNRIRMQHEIVLQKQKASELEMQALRAQMNPHFIFNSLNSINMFILENNKLQASEYLSKFSRLVRLILQNSQEALIPLERELEALQLYLELESLRFDQRFEYKISTGDEVDPSVLKVPPLIVQPYVENAIWHGLMHKKEKGLLEIELYQQEEILFCKITDDGVGRKKAAELKSKSALTYKSAGMGITASRIALLQQRKQNEVSISINDLVLSDGSPGGTEVLIKLPLHYD